MPEQEPATPLIFLSYSHEAPGHLQRASELCDHLRRLGFDCRMDQHEVFPSQGWDAWCAKQLEKAACVLVVCSREYLERQAQGHGALWHGAILPPAAFDRKDTRFVPVLFERTDLAFVPAPLQQSSHFHLSDERGMELLAIYLGEKLLPVGGEPASPLPALPVLQDFPSPLPVVKPWLAPCRTAGTFIGRSKDLRKIESAFSKRRNFTLTAANAGVGRKQLVLQFLQRKAEGITAALWLQWGNETFLLHELRRALEALPPLPLPEEIAPDGALEGMSAEMLAALLGERLACCRGWVLVLDQWPGECAPFTMLLDALPGVQRQVSDNIDVDTADELPEATGMVLHLPLAGEKSSLPEDDAVLNIGTLPDKELLALLRNRSGRRALTRPERDAALQLGDLWERSTVGMDLLGVLAARTQSTFRELVKAFKDVSKERGLEVLLKRTAGQSPHRLEEFLFLVGCLVKNGAIRMPLRLLDQALRSALPDGGRVAPEILVAEAEALGLVQHLESEKTCVFHHSFQFLADYLIPEDEREQLVEAYTTAIAQAVPPEEDARGCPHLLWQASRQAMGLEVLPPLPLPEPEPEPEFGPEPAFENDAATVQDQVEGASVIVPESDTIPEEETAAPGEMEPVDDVAPEHEELLSDAAFRRSIEEQAREFFEVVYDSPESEEGTPFLSVDAPSDSEAAAAETADLAPDSEEATLPPEDGGFFAPEENGEDTVAADDGSEMDTGYPEEHDTGDHIFDVQDEGDAEEPFEAHQEEAPLVEENAPLDDATPFEDTSVSEDVFPLEHDPLSGADDGGEDDVASVEEDSFGFAAAGEEDLPSEDSLVSAADDFVNDAAGSADATDYSVDYPADSTEDDADGYAIGNAEHNPFDDASAVGDDNAVEDENVAADEAMVEEAIPNEADLLDEGDIENEGDLGDEGDYEGALDAEEPATPPQEAFEREAAYSPWESETAPVDEVADTDNFAPLADGTQDFETAPQEYATTAAEDAEKAADEAYSDRPRMPWERPGRKKVATESLEEESESFSDSALDEDVNPAARYLASKRGDSIKPDSTAEAAKEDDEDSPAARYQALKKAWEKKQQEAEEKRKKAERKGFLQKFKKASPKAKKQSLPDKTEKGPETGASAPGNGTTKNKAQTHEKGGFTLLLAMLDRFFYCGRRPRKAVLALTEKDGASTNVTSPWESQETSTPEVTERNTAGSSTDAEGGLFSDALEPGGGLAETPPLGNASEESPMADTPDAPPLFADVSEAEEPLSQEEGAEEREVTAPPEVADSGEEDYFGAGWGFSDEPEFEDVAAEPELPPEAVERPRAPSVRPADSEPDLPATAAECVKRAEMYIEQGRLHEAEPFYARALQLQQKLHGERHLEVAKVANAFGELYKMLEEYEQAEPLFEMALEIRVEVWGDEHREVAQSCTNLGSLRMAQRRRAEAEALYVRALRMDETLFGADHPNTATDCNNLAVLYFSMERFAEALRNIKRAIAIRENTLGEGHPHHVQACENCAAILRKLGRSREAEEVLLRARIMRNSGQHEQTTELQEDGEMPHGELYGFSGPDGEEGGLENGGDDNRN